MKFQTPFNRTTRYYERITEPSMTVPDQTMSMKEILRRFASGLPIGGIRVPLYEGEEDYENSFLEGIDPKTLDISELDELKKHTADTILNLQTKLQKKSAKKEDERSEALPTESSPQDVPNP
ncbi:MAG: hypothetical protein [Microvirus sp.]|nr:MAG: hypothetical protein [Microvirus sp.]